MTWLSCLGNTHGFLKGQWLVMTVPQVPAVLLHRIEQELDAEERETMQYLCRDLVPDVPAAETRKLFVALNEREILTLSTLSELLYRLKRFDLLRKVLGTGRAAVEASLSQFPPLIPKYRVLMAEISKELDEEDLHSFMFLMMNDTSYGKTAKEKTFLTIITDLENLDLVSPSRLDFLEDCFLHMRRRDLVKRIQKFKQEEHPIGTSSVCANRLQASFPELSIADPPAVGNQGRLSNGECAFQAAKVNISIPETGGAEAQVLNKYRMRSKPLGVCLIIDCIGNDTSKCWEKLNSSLTAGVCNSRNLLTAQIGPEVVEVLYKPYLVESKEQSMETLPSPGAGGFYLLKGLSVNDPPRNHYPHTEESGSMREHAGSLHSFAASQDLKAGNVREPSLQQSAGQDQLKPAEESALYKMNRPRRGYCLIFNNVYFKGLRPRSGSQKDAMELESVFKWLGFEVKKYDDKTSDELLKLLKDWQSSEYWKDSDCLVCCILSHGESGKIYATDGCLISINKITSFFTAKQCALLAKKPKLFFIQACQGSKLHQPVYLEADNHETCSPGADAQTSGFIPTQQQMTSSIPEEADFLLGMATVDGYYSYRDVQRGTWFIQVLCEKLRELVPRREDILSILTAVNDDVSKLSDKNGLKKQMPQPAYTLRKKLIFPVPSNSPPVSKQL
uniref:uncharacterized protein LOC114584652 n=1 Tax=Podarcis muralis TaxID=64176 RepID=UPI00109F7247|nr:uncharacterized protein LOC114584652 [Podarcis muralis]